MNVYANRFESNFFNYLSVYSTNFKEILSLNYQLLTNVEFPDFDETVRFMLESSFGDDTLEENDPINDVDLKKELIKKKSNLKKLDKKVLINYMFGDVLELILLISN